MNTDHLLKIIDQGEGLHTEFKQADGSLPGNLFDTVSAFLNTDDGMIFLGVRNISKYLPLYAKDAHPQFVETIHGFELTLPLRQSKSGVESGVESEMAVQILTILRDDTKALSKSQLAVFLGKKKPTRYLNDLMSRLIQQQLVAYTVPEKPNSRLQKYCLTEKGKTHLKSKKEGGSQ